MNNLRSKGSALQEWIIGVAIALIIWSIFAVNYNAARKKRDEYRCADNLGKLGAAYFMYAVDYDELLPPNSENGVSILLKNRYLMKENSFCPSLGADGVSAMNGYGVNPKFRRLDDYGTEDKNVFVADTKKGKRLTNASALAFRHQPPKSYLGGRVANVLLGNRSVVSVTKEDSKKLNF